MFGRLTPKRPLTILNYNTYCHKIDILHCKVTTPFGVLANASNIVDAIHAYDDPVLKSTWYKVGILPVYVFDMYLGYDGYGLNMIKLRIPCLGAVGVIVAVIGSLDPYGPTSVEVTIPCQSPKAAREPREVPAAQVTCTSGKCLLFAYRANHFWGPRRNIKSNKWKDKFCEWWTPCHVKLICSSGSLYEP